ncbi:BAG family molecular chaperone regulator 5 [uncultured Bifidobacterium sp.]|nr:BAG family molecular chaperone regulator 5 [uncultured Bifidobacterium sp.]MEE0654200.1 BAG family molecular chaperone regulator 5 [Bifidobacterium criceti]
MQGTERFDADGVKLEPGDMRTREERAADDDLRILGELPPHWGVFEERGK